MIRRVWQLASAASTVSRVIVATDDDRILSTIVEAGGEAVLTPSTCANGTERVHAAASSLAGDYDYIVNVQGDSPLLPPWILDELLTTMHAARASFATPAVALSWEQCEKLQELRAQGNSSGTTVVSAQDGRALYFSSALLPFIRQAKRPEQCPVKKHIGVYAYTPEVLQQYMDLPASTLESLEKLEQLRALEHGLPIHVVDVDLKGKTLWSVDSPEDVEIAEEIIRREGELITASA